MVGQKQAFIPFKKPIEVELGANYPLLLNSYSVPNMDELEPRPGFGISARSFFLQEKRANIVLGARFENINYSTDYIYCGHFCDYYDVKFNSYIFSIPLLLRLNARNNFKVFLDAGPDLTLVLNLKAKGTRVNYNIEDGSETSEDFKSTWKHNSFDYGINLQIGSHIPIKEAKLLVSFALRMGLRDIDDERYAFSKFCTMKVGTLIE